MFCQNCGVEVQSGQPYCAGCGRSLTGYAAPRQGRLEHHVQLLGILWIAYSAFSLVGSVAVWIVAQVIFGRHSQINADVPGFLHPLLMGVALFLLIKSAVGIAAGVGLRQHSDWARVVAIVLGFLELLHVPLGTALGIYTIWALLSRGAESEYKSLPQVA